MASLSVANFKNLVLDALTGVGATGPGISLLVMYSQGSAPASPETAITGSKEFSSATAAIDIISKMGAAASGISTLSVSASPVTPASATGVTGINRARLHNGDGTAIADFTAGTSGAEVTIASANSSTGVGSTVTAFAIRMPLNNGGSVKINTSLANWITDFITGVETASADLGTGSQLKLYTGTAPASADDVATGTLLATINFGSPAYGYASGGASALSGDQSGTASATGTVGYARLVKGGYVLQGSAGLSGTDFILDNVSLTSGVTVVSVTEATISL